MGSTPTMDGGALGSPRSTESANYSALMWEQTLVDHLLNFAGTPKGLLLLQQTGAMNEAVAYMNGRYTQKLQVSKTEKFGYGFMVTQVASTSPGVMALENTGFIQALLHELWSVLECGRDDQPCFGSNSHQAHSIDDRPAQKDLFDRIIIVNSDVKSHFLFNPEQTQVFGLRLLNVMSTCLDSWLLLETQYKLWDFLLDEQNSNRNDENGEIMIDHMSLERNHILVRTNVIGGPTERTLPARSLSEDTGKVYPWRMFSSFPVPKEYFTTVNRSSPGKTDSAFGEFLEKPSDGMSPTEWLKLCQDTFCHELKSNPEGIQGKVLVELLEKVLAVQQQIPDEYQTFPLKPCKVTDATLKGRKLSNMQTLGSKMAVRYGKHLKLLSGNSSMNESLNMLLKKCQFFLQSQQRSFDSEIESTERNYMGHDWFASTIFIMMSGNKERAWSFLHVFSSLLASGYLWMPRLHTSIHLPIELAVSSIHPVFSTVCHNVEIILQLELPRLFSAFRLSGFTPSQICQNWLRQCFWNYLDWTEVCQYVAVCMLMGADYQVYYCVSVLKYLQPKILIHTQQQQLQVFLKENSLDGYHVGEHTDFMRNLETKFRNIVLKDMQTLNKG